MISVGAIVGSFALDVAENAMRARSVGRVGTVGIALALVLFGLAHYPAMALCAAFVAGASWTVVLATLYVSAQIRAARLGARARPGDFPDRDFRFGDLRQLRLGPYRRALGDCPRRCSSPPRRALVAIPLTWRWKLQTAEGVDLSPSMHWRAPMLARKVEDENGPVLVTVTVGGGR